MWVRVPQREHGHEDWVLVEPHLGCQNVEVAQSLAVVRRGRVPVKVRNEKPYAIQLHKHQRLARVTMVEPHQVREARDVSFRQVCPAVVEVALT